MAERKRRRVLGYILTGLGVASIVDFFSPIPIPTVGITSFVSGGILIAAGLYFLYLRDMDWKSLIGGARTARRLQRRPPLDPLVPVGILKLAREKAGILTVATVAMALSLPLDTAEQGLEECVSRGVASPDFDETKSAVVYRFPEFLPPPPPGDPADQGER